MQTSSPPGQHPGLKDPVKPGTDPESQAFIESWFSKLKERCVWREEFETLDDAREQIGRYIDRYPHRPHSRLAYKTPREVAALWKGANDDLIPAA